MKKFLLFACGAAMSLASNAAYLYWQVDDAAVDEYNASGQWTPISSGAYAILKDSDGNTYNTYGAQGMVTDGKGSINQAYYSEGIGTDGAGYSYFVELYNSDNTLIARSQAIDSSSGEAWTAAYDAALRTATLSNIPAISVWHAGGFTAVPEPTSGLMLLLGAAMLGLRRKNRSVA